MVSASYRFFHWYNFDIIPVLGKVITGDREPYEYLVESILQFPNQVTSVASKIIQSSIYTFQVKLLQEIKDTGFQHVDYEDLTFGLVAIHSAFKH